MNEAQVSKEEKAASSQENLVSMLSLSPSICRKSAELPTHTSVYARNSWQGIRVERESERAKLSIKEVLEQKRINDATGSLVKEHFANVR